MLTAGLAFPLCHLHGSRGLQLRRTGRSLGIKGLKAIRFEKDVPLNNPNLSLKDKTPATIVLLGHLEFLGLDR